METKEEQLDERRLRLKRRTMEEREGRDVEPSGIIDELDDERSYA